MSAGMSTKVTITFTPKLNQDINSYFRILSETGQIEIPLTCTCKKALISLEEDHIDFGNVIIGEHYTKYLKLKNNGSLPTKVYIKTNDGKKIPFFSMEDLRKREEKERLMTDAEFMEYKPEPLDKIELEEFLAQVSFKRTSDINGYSECKIPFTFIPCKLTEIQKDFTLFFENQDHADPIPISISGECVDVPIYVQEDEYELNVFEYDQTYK